MHPPLIYPTILRMHPWFGQPEEELLPGRPEDYRVEQQAEDWFVVRDPCGRIVHSGLGPVQILPVRHG
ncbi:hypothetical protein N5K37_23810 [Delftia tsuruhatensis]|uniref:Uncharacterized protein n=1 Tax=Delftia tsuruhatensis TaxID=180282 RepID=A0ABM6DXY8_9BURK|nr:hypothetical protein [Delftia tsuruhatensis]AOU99868.1 hypothetical protein BI380_00100 [Delftia tsuruhatensis]MDH2232939.1 hypothetical protein [Delftia tsuruhatensis]